MASYIEKLSTELDGYRDKLNAKHERCPFWYSKGGDCRNYVAMDDYYNQFGEGKNIDGYLGSDSRQIVKYMSGITELEGKANSAAGECDSISKLCDFSESLEQAIISNNQSVYKSDIDNIRGQCTALVTAINDLCTECTTLREKYEDCSDRISKYIDYIIRRREFLTTAWDTQHKKYDSDSEEQLTYDVFIGKWNKMYYYKSIGEQYKIALSFEEWWDKVPYEG